jgi:hypothetical protein
MKLLEYHYEIDLKNLYVIESVKSINYYQKWFLHDFDDENIIDIRYSRSFYRTKKWILNNYPEFFL